MTRTELLALQRCRASNAMLLGKTVVSVILGSLEMSKESWLYLPSYDKVGAHLSYVCQIAQFFFDPYQSEEVTFNIPILEHCTTHHGALSCLLQPLCSQRQRQSKRPGRARKEEYLVPVPEDDLNKPINSVIEVARSCV